MQSKTRKSTENTLFPAWREADCRCHSLPEAKCCNKRHSHRDCILKITSAANTPIPLNVGSVFFSWRRRQVCDLGSAYGDFIQFSHFLSTLIWLCAIFSIISIWASKAKQRDVALFTIKAKINGCSFVLLSFLLLSSGPVVDRKLIAARLFNYQSVKHLHHSAAPVYLSASGRNHKRS